MIISLDLNIIEIRYKNKKACEKTLKFSFVDLLPNIRIMELIQQLIFLNHLFDG